MPPHHTHLGNRFFEFEYIKLIQDSFPLMLSCRNVTVQSNYLNNLFCQAFIIQGVNLVERIQDYKFKSLRILGQPHTTQPRYRTTQ